MLNFIYEALGAFRGIFSRESTWLVFVMVVLGFIGTTELIGVTSFCRFWGLEENGYKVFLHFFRSNAYSLTAIVCQWSAFVLAQNKTIMAQGRAVLQGDHTYVPKDGRQMPGVVSLHQNSETQSKPSYFRGHCWGAICILVGSLAAPFGLPLDFAIHQGLIHIGEKKTDENNVTLGTRMIQMALSFAIRHNMPSVLTLDAYFPCAAVFKLAYSVWSIDLQQPLLTLIVRAKRNCVAYYEPEKTEGKKYRGRPRKYGDKVTLMNLFDQPERFSKAQCQVYGKLEEVSFMAINLLWKPTGDFIRFVLAVTSRGPIVLMCSDLNQNPLLALELYCFRTRIETMFDMLKNLMGAFNYHFWSKLLPRHSRKPKKNKDLKKPALDTIDTVKGCWEACERFVMIAAISLGLLQLISLNFKDSIWNRFKVYLRTRSRYVPSERTVKHVIARLLVKDLLSSAPSRIMSKIRSHYFETKSPSKGSLSAFLC